MNIAHQYDPSCFEKKGFSGDLYLRILTLHQMFFCETILKTCIFNVIGSNVFREIRGNRSSHDGSFEAVVALESKLINHFDFSQETYGFENLRIELFSLEKQSLQKKINFLLGFYSQVVFLLESLKLISFNVSGRYEPRFEFLLPEICVSPSISEDFAYQLGEIVTEWYWESVFEVLNVSLECRSSIDLL